MLVEGNPTPEKLTQLEKGIQLKEYRSLPAKARLIPTPNLPPVTTHRLDRNQTAGRQEASNPTHDRRFKLIHAAPGPRGDWFDSNGRFMGGRMA